MRDRSCQSVRLSVNISREVADAIFYLCDSSGESITDVVGIAIGTTAFFVKEQRKGSEIVLRDGRGTSKIVLEIIGQL